MSLTVKNLEADPFVDSFTHPVDERPYRMIVFSGFDHQKAPVYWVAGTTDAVLNAKNALSLALKTHAGCCFFCETTDNLEIDHVIPVCRGGGENLANLLVACKTCNRQKADKALEHFDPAAAQRWLLAVLAQTRRRLDGIQNSKTAT